MASNSPRDRSVERLIETALRQPVPPASSTCVDAELLAAWAEGGLAADRAADIEHHLSVCGRCQAMAAAFAAAEPAGQTVGAQSADSSVPWWRRRPVRWTMSLAAGTVGAAVLIWLAAPASVDDPVPAQQATRLEPVAPAPSAGVTAPTPAAPQSAPALEPRRQRESGAPARERETVTTLPTESPEAAALSSAPAPVAPKMEPAGEKPSAPPPAAARRPAAAESVAPEPVTEFPATVAPRDAVSAGEDASGIAGGRFGAANAAADARRASPASVRWRVYSDGSVRRSVDGSSWELVTLDPQALVTAGAAPSPAVCWFVGRDGAVFVTVDGGERFERVPFPETADLAGVSAADARQATVTTADGRRFTTADGGASWR